MEKCNYPSRKCGFFSSGPLDMKEDDSPSQRKISLSGINLSTQLRFVRLVNLQITISNMIYKA